MRFAGRDDQRAADQAAGLQFLQQQARHDRFAGPGIVGQQEADSRQLQEVVVDRLKLVGQRIDAGDREREERVVLVGQAQPMSLDTQAEERRVAIEALVERRASELSELSAVRTGSRTRPVLHPLPINLMESPSATIDRTSTGSGSSGPLITEPTWISSIVMAA